MWGHQCIIARNQVLARAAVKIENKTFYVPDF
jgi:hypothetical protein